MRDFHALPLSKLRKRELRALIVEMRLREDETRARLLRELPPERAVAVSLALSREALQARRVRELEAVSPTRETGS